MEDCFRIPKTIDLIIAARGTYIPDGKDVRNGARKTARRDHEKAHGESLLDVVDQELVAAISSIHDNFIPGTTACPFELEEPKDEEDLGDSDSEDSEDDSDYSVN